MRHGVPLFAVIDNDLDAGVKPHRMERPTQARRSNQKSVRFYTSRLYGTVFQE